MSVILIECWVLVLFFLTVTSTTVTTHSFIRGESNAHRHSGRPSSRSSNFNSTISPTSFFRGTNFGHHHYNVPPEVFRGKICIGTNGRMSVPSNRSHHFRNLKDRYTNCTYVEGNLELTWIQDQDMDLSFLEYIREVTGYVLISHVDVRRIVLPSLQVIRGRTRFRLNVHEDEFALMVTLSRMDNLELPALRDVLAGNVGVFNNYNLCHVKTINWDEIISGINAKYVFVYNFTQLERKCPTCDSSCEAGCWGEGPHNCQKFSKINCSPQCHEGRCYGKEPRQCCHLSCAGGCTGPKKSDCLACKKFYDDGECKDECPSLVIYNPNTYLSERNPKGKYAYGATCVKECPEHLLRDAGSGACVRSCPPDKEQSVDGECLTCSGPCRKTCQGPSNAIIHSGNINTFRNCTIIEGSIQILETSFNGFQEVHQNYTFGERYKPMDPAQLEIFSTLKEVTGYINIQASHPNFTDLHYLRNLETIGGRDKAEFFSALYIVKTSLRSLNLRSLKRIRSGTVAILENPNLCFAYTIKWRKLLSNKTEEQIFNNQLPEKCRSLGRVCSSQCSDDGCWGPTPTDCLSCAKYKLGDQCIPNCNAEVGIYEDSPGFCKHCHHECLDTCNGKGSGNCTRCKNVKDGPFCVESCPLLKYNMNGECQECHSNCLDGCSGPENAISAQGCNSCHQAVVDEHDQILQCLGKDEQCPSGYYHEAVGPTATGALKALIWRSICKKCHPKCKRCTAYGFHVQVCQECSFFQKGEQCEDECPEDSHYIENKECFTCANECIGCTGPSPSECLTCRYYRIFSELNTDNQHNNESFTCRNSCPPELPNPIEDNGPSYCGHAEAPADNEIAMVVGGVVCVFILIAIIVGLNCCVKYMSKQTEMKTLTKLFSPETESTDPPVRPSNIKPDLSKFRTVKEDELRKGEILGCGAFGTVYKGVWIPEGQNVKIPVAIKVLRDGMGKDVTNEFLDEAFIMARVEHPHLLRLLSVCLTSQLMLVTQLMPLGCLRDYVQNNKDKIGSKALLNWCTQIAKGMEYLESKRLVHRDLAARNVLVHTPTYVKITDFGLAKLLDLDEDEYRAEGGKMPIKWLALESIRDRVFTHKTDVWAFGVTVWELVTFGGKPYEHISAKDLYENLVKGVRLEQSQICTLDFHMILIKTWVKEPDARPSFRFLVEEFTKFARDPGRYLVIPGDKLMRLPSYTQQDETELIRSLASALEGPGVIMNASEYFDNQNPGIRNCTNGNLAKRNPFHNSMTDASWVDSLPLDYPNKHSIMSRLSRYPKNQVGSPRYFSDMSKIIGADGQMSSDDLLMAHENGAISRSMRVDLPVDEDDYLMPSPQNIQNSSTYLDLVGDSSGSVDGNFGHNGRKSNRYPILIDNPEYQLTGRDYTNVPLAFAPIGLPQIRRESHQASSNQLGNTSRNTAQPPIYHQYHNQYPIRRQGSRSEEESDHEYYNELERLKREKQPLQQRKGETSV